VDRHCPESGRVCELVSKGFFFLLRNHPSLGKRKKNKQCAHELIISFPCHNDLVGSLVSKEDQTAICLDRWKHESYRFTEAYHAFRCVDGLLSAATFSLFKMHDERGLKAFDQFVGSLHRGFLGYLRLQECDGFGLAASLFNELLYMQMSPDVEARLYISFDFVGPLQRIIADKFPSGSPGSGEVDAILTMLVSKVSRFPSAPVSRDVA
jgi:hypothetical protein